MRYLDVEAAVGSTPGALSFIMQTIRSGYSKAMVCKMTQERFFEISLNEKNFDRIIEKYGIERTNLPSGGPARRKRII